MEDLFNKVEFYIQYCKCNSDEKNNLNDTLQMFSMMVTEVSIDIHLKQFGLNANIREKLNDIIKNYESIFLWNIKKVKNPYNNWTPSFNLINFKSIDDIRKNISDKNKEFNENR